MSYFRVSAPPDTLSYYVWADNENHARRKVIEFAGDVLKNGQSLYRSVKVAPSDVPADEEVIDEPELDAAGRAEPAEEEPVYEPAPTPLVTACSNCEKVRAENMRLTQQLMKQSEQLKRLQAAIAARA